MHHHLPDLFPCKIHFVPCVLQLSEEAARSELFSSTQRLRAEVDPNKHHIGDQLAGRTLVPVKSLVLCCRTFPITHSWNAFQAYETLLYLFIHACCLYMPGFLYGLAFQSCVTPAIIRC